MNLPDELQQIEPTENHQGQSDTLLLELPPQYEILGEIAGGAMGSVFRARNCYTGAHVAIKIMKSESSRNTVAIQRFFLEAKAASLLKHPNICRLLDFGVNKSGKPYLVMDWIDGINLEKKVVDGNGLSIPEALLVFRQVASALAHAHQKKIIHRDLKPENIMINNNADGQMEIQLVDFGIAKMLDNTEYSMQVNTLTRVGLAVGTPAYMSPEQAKGAAVDGRTDIYSLGCVMYFALSGKPPFASDNIKQLMEKHLYEPPPAISSALNIPEALNTIVFKAMNKNVADRYATMEDLIADLDKLMRPAESANEPVVIKSKPGWRKLVFWALSFIIGFSMIYAARVALQYVLDASDSNLHKKPTVTHHDATANPHIRLQNHKP